MQALQTSIFDPPQVMPPYQRHSETSRDAAVAIAPVVSGLHAKVLDTIKAAGGCTDEEGQALSGISGNTYRPRRVWLADNGYITRAGARKTTSGRAADVWRAAL